MARDYISIFPMLSPFRSHQEKDFNVKEPSSPLLCEAKSLDLDLDNDAYAEPIYKESTNPTGMVISAQFFCLAKEAKLDPTWLD